jgi:hypothetical protein
MGGHLLGAGGAVEAHDLHPQRVHHRGRGLDVGADQERPGGLHGYLDHERQIASAGLGPGGLGAVDRRLDL